MPQLSWKAIQPHAIIIGIFLVIALIYCKPALEGKVLQQEDVTQWQAMSQNQRLVQEKTGEVPLWTNGMFSGMPGYLIIGNANNAVPYYVAKVASAGLPKPANMFFLACVCMYILALSFGANPWVGLVTGLGYAYATYNPVIIATGHDTKMLSIALLPAFIAGLQLIYNKKYALGAGVTAAFFGALVAMNHYQIVYYGGIIAAFMSVGYAIQWILQKQFKHLLFAAGIALGACTVGLLSNAVVIFTNYEYTQETIRGGSALADAKAAVKADGLKTDYALSYSMYKTEPFVLLFPRIFGGSSNAEEIKPETSKAIEAIQALPQELGQQLAPYLGAYWGGIGGTSGPPYAGALLVVLALLGLGTLPNQHKWWILGCIVLTVLMSWGSYFLGFNTFLLEHLPMYNKFRAPSMIMIVPTLLVNILATLTLQQAVDQANNNSFSLATYKKGLYVVAVVFAAALLLYVQYDYKGENDKQVLAQIASAPAEIQEGVKSVFNALAEDRKSLFLGDIFRSLFLGLLGLAGVWAIATKKTKSLWILAVFAVVSLGDLLSIGSTYLNAKNYQDKEEAAATFTPTEADKQILADTSFFRVLDITNGLGSALTYGAKTAYFHKSIGGYHPAKLSIYQDLIDEQLSKFPNCMPVLNMLNTKYIIGGQDRANPQVQINSSALGNAWFVKAIKFVPTAKAEMDALTTLNTKDTAVARSSYETVLGGATGVDTAATIQLIANQNDVVTYQTNNSQKQLAVFSEVFYSKGWNAYIDGTKTEFGKVNYVLRGMVIPAGKHEVVFKFEPASHKIGTTTTTIFSVLLLVLLVAGIGLAIRNKKV